MGSKLSTVNPYMRDSVTRERLVLRSVATSSAIEGIYVPFKKMQHKTAKAASSAAKIPASIKR